MKTRIIAAALALALAAAAPAAAMAGAPTDRVRLATDKVITILKDPALKPPAKEKDRRAKIRNAVYEVFDFEEMAKRSLATFWRDRTAADRKEFVDLFSDLLERSYINRIENYSDEKIVYTAEDTDGDYSVVKSKFVTKRGEEIEVDYKLMNRDKVWYVYDVVIESVSLVNNYRVQFNKVIRSSSYQELVKKMKNKKESETFVSPGKG